MSLSHRERVICALSHRTPDRVPCDLMGNATMLLDNTYLRLRDYLGLAPIPPVRSGTSANYYDERILEHFDIDFRRIFLKRGPRNEVIYHDDGTFTDAWGIRYKEAGIFVNALEHPLGQATTIDDIEAYPVAQVRGPVQRRRARGRSHGGCMKRPTMRWSRATRCRRAFWTAAAT